MLARHRTWLVLAAVVALAAAVRFPPFLEDSFPLGDGALWATMVDDVRAAGYALPRETSFNGGGTPFSYPPLAFYAAAFAVDLTPLDTLSALRWLPLIASLATPLAVAWLALGLLGSRPAALWAATIVALLPNSFAWLIMGGGLTRSLGLLLAVVALALFDRTVREPGSARALAAGVAVGAAALSHPENVVFLALSLPLVWLSSGASRSSLRRVAAVVVVAGAVVAPWAVTVLARHGVEPFLGASTSSAWSLSGRPDVFRFELTGEPWLAVFAALALVGCFVAIARRRVVLPLWLLALYQVVPRSAGTYAQVLVALLAAVTLSEVVTPGLERLAAAGRGAAGVGGAWRGRLSVWGLTGALVLYGLMADLRWLQSPSCPLHPIADEHRRAFDIVRDAAPPGAAFVVVTGNREWHLDFEAEWFPYLTGCTSATTVQGTEWLPRGGFSDRLGLHYQAWTVASREPRAFEGWLRSQLPEVDRILLVGTRSRPTVAGVARALRASATCTLEASTPDCASFRLVTPTAPGSAASDG